ncbi:TPA: hypothetical protein L4577_005792 [Pseudomonas aeruginosa]|nr:hypothetical protein [Pseudomonas aeruginosa]
MRLKKEQELEFKENIDKLERLIRLRSVTKDDEELVRNCIKSVLERKINYYARALKNKEIAIHKYKEYLDEVSLNEYIEFLNDERTDESLTEGLANLDDKIGFLDGLDDSVKRIDKKIKIDMFKRYLRINDAKYLA